MADIEGLAIAAEPSGRRFLVASSQGSSSYAAFDSESSGMIGRFRVHGGEIDGTSGTDGIDLAIGDFGPAYPRGIFVAHDEDNDEGGQNFKFVSWLAIKAALNLR